MHKYCGDLYMEGLFPYRDIRLAYFSIRLMFFYLNSWIPHILTNSDFTLACLELLLSLLFLL